MQWSSTDRDTEIVGHVPYNIAPRMSAFFMRDMNKAFTEITGAKLNRRAGYGLGKSHVSTVYMNLTVDVDKLKEVVESPSFCQHQMLEILGFRPPEINAI